MKILITSGGTTEKIDSVRGITNHSTGNLGKLIAETFLAQGHEVTLVTTKQAVKPASQPNLNLHEISNVESLLTTMEGLVKTHDVLIHSMAVSDYTPVYMTDIDELEKTEQISDLLSKSNSENKISSQADYQVLFLKKTPKIISLVKEWNPAIRLIGFKLLVDVPKEELFRVARASLQKNQADYILANDLTEISPTQHHAYLLSEDDSFEAFDKEGIAQLIYEKVVTHD
ncbi:phosphopantothenate--cysteine ligase [Streptococcus loxodontisalivarius]|uniref:Phosphopantothenate-cysteine ligase n=1 Tax=Streptococcus loxodontisalivarius TaxID=1349415 RepID=A0ABS2PPY1_9STRE|nr:phosphopantothenate--cysteine ligase [Streptococcus loxodontisalivarius]MBM7642008.1 phosphopantothenate-cysteine ligase [Streptococcus loxodontisalivarius]